MGSRSHSPGPSADIMGASAARSIYMFSRLHTLSIFCGGLAALLCVASPLRAADDEALKEWETKKSLSEKYFSDMKVLGDRRIEDLFHIRLEGKVLAFSSPSAATPGEKQMRV